MANRGLTQPVLHPMVKLQRQIAKLVNAQVLKPSDRLWKIALLYGDEWAYWKRELEEFQFSMQDPISDLLAVETWEEDE
ncbi:MAG TPA: DUF4327 family protein [Synechococcales cyanobacterium M55_K2018_004]|nr:DUF4327 family protein [Synechococcales cyanobacterium M55_K2018_004]